MFYFDVKYTSPVGNHGVHCALKAQNKYEAARISPVLLSFGTPWTPDQFNIVSVNLAAELPAHKKKVSILSRLSYKIKVASSKYLGNL